MKTILAIALGGSIGALSRYGLSWFIFKHIKTYFPISTLAVNLIGAFLIGLLWGLFEQIKIPTNIRIFIYIGILGSFTTFSTFALDNYAMLKEGKILAAASNILITNILGIGLVFFGMFVSSWLATLRT
ncbi:MAG: fluoride efflux transporter CrcB [Candidatus Saganbacteria bacterium]|nr:fluoride efflux transporter CrcB [Candidatus Saganbacteria bacterium]